MRSTDRFVAPGLNLSLQIWSCHFEVTSSETRSDFLALQTDSRWLFVLNRCNINQFNDLCTEIVKAAVFVSFRLKPCLFLTVRHGCSSLRKLIDTFESVQKRVPETSNRHSVLHQGSTCWESFWRQGNAKNAEHGKLINSKNMKKSKSWFLVFTCLKRVTVLFLDSLNSRKPSQHNKSEKMKIFDFS